LLNKLLTDGYFICSVVYPGKAELALLVISNLCFPDKVHWTEVQSSFERLTQ